MSRMFSTPHADGEMVFDRPKAADDGSTYDGAIDDVPGK